MSGNISYTPSEVADILKISKFTVYELIKRGELAAYHVGRKVRVEAPDLEAFKQRAKGMAQQGPGNMPATALPIAEPVIICGQDAILDILVRRLERELPGNNCLRAYMGSINGLLALYYGKANVATAHLWDGDSDEYNLPYIRRILPGQKMVAINLVFRTQGFYAAEGNPLGIGRWADLARPDIRFVNREPGSGTRVLLDEQLRKLGIDHHQVPGYDRVETTHLAVASCVARGAADVGLGTESVAGQVKGLDFIPLQKERYDLVMRKEDLDRPYGKAILNLLRSISFRNEVSGMGRYDISQMGKLIAEVY
ncbi:MAG: helix-turn-helix transcriptional regulator [Thermacetogeniaceae bacterium]|jgi:putative molybdopterin biosynthesis protein